MKRDGERIKDVTIKALAVVGLLALLAVGSFTTISFARYAGGALSYLASAAVTLSSIFVPSEKNLAVTASEVNIGSGSKSNGKLFSGKN